MTVPAFKFTDGMLAMAQINAAATPLDIEPLSAREVVTEDVELHAPAAQLNGLP